MVTENEIVAQAIKNSIRAKLDQSKLGPFAQYHSFLIPTHLVKEWYGRCDTQSAFRKTSLTPYSMLDFFYISPESDSRMSFWRTPLGSLIWPPERGWQELRLSVQPANQGYDSGHHILAHRLILENGKEPKLQNTISNYRWGFEKVQTKGVWVEDLEQWKLFADNSLDYNLNPHLGFGLPIVGQS